jgi:DNA-binding CsgD family transcriptional regulator
MRGVLRDDGTAAAESGPGGEGDPVLPRAIRSYYPDTAALVVPGVGDPAASSATVPAQRWGPGCAGDPFAALTPREMEVLRRIAAGQNTATMVREMKVTPATLRTYVKNVLGKLGAHSRLEAAALASRQILPGPGEPRRDHPLLAALTPREREVLIHLANGFGLREVGKRLHMSQKTVNTHLQNLRNKLGVHSTLEAVALVRSRLDRRSPN